MINFILEDEEIYLRFSGESFTEILIECKKFNLKFDKINKSWTGDNSSLFNIIPELKKIEDFEVSNEIMEIIKPKLSIVRKRRVFKKELLKCPPILGKSPNENYQIEDITKSICSNRKILNLDTGLGKSYIGSVVLSHLVNAKEIDSVLIVCPNHLKVNWKKELIKFYYEDLTDEDFYITSIFNREPFESNKKFIITSYRNLVMVSDDYYKKIKKKKSKKYTKTCLPIDKWFSNNNRALICDESHSAKNNSRQTQILLQIKNYFEFRYLMSATITPNSIVDIYYQAKLLDENLIYKSYNGFLEYIAHLGTRFSEYDIKIDKKTGKKMFKEDKILELKELLAPHIIVRKKEDCLDLPEHRILKNYCSLEGINLEIYREVISYCLNIVKEEKGYIDSREVKNKLPYILQALNNINMLKGKIDEDKNKSLYKKIESWKFKDHPKLELLDELIYKYIDEEKEKVILYSYHPKTIDDLKIIYEKYNPLIIHGQIEIAKENKDREGEKEFIINNFKTNKTNKLLISNPTIIKTGLTITESCRIVYFDRDYNFETYYQSKDRIYRIGQKKQTIINNLIIENSFDEVIDKCLDDKKDVNDIFTKTETKDLKSWKNLFEGKL